MIPQFPEFKKLELSDKGEIEAILSAYPTYSDFEFTSLWTWNVKEDMRVSLIHGNIAIRFTDYLTGHPFFTYFGGYETNDTADKLIGLSLELGFGPSLHLIPEISTHGLDQERFLVEESRDHFDYIYDVERYITYGGAALKSRRNFFNRFKTENPDYEVAYLDLKEQKTKEAVTDLYRHWEEGKGFVSMSESFAYERFLDSVHYFDHTAIGIFVKGKLIAFHVSALPAGECANGLFEKADTSYNGVYQALMHEVSKDLIRRGRTRLNYEQDLGIEGLRRSKTAFDPVMFMKKYRISRKS